MRKPLVKLATGLLVVLLVAAIVGLIAVVVMPVAFTEPLTEFYVLNTEGQAGNYPTNLSVGERGSVVIGIENHEHQDMSYTIILSVGGAVLDSRMISVADDHHWRGKFSFVFESPGERQLVFDLYRGRNSDRSGEPYRRLWVFVTVESA